MKQYPTPNFAIGDRVAYSVQFLKSIGMSHSDIAHARGTIIGLNAFKGFPSIVEIKWDKGEFPGKVLDVNLAKVGPNPRFANVD